MYLFRTKGHIIHVEHQVPNIYHENNNTKAKSNLNARLDFSIQDLPITA